MHHPVSKAFRDVCYLKFVATCVDHQRFGVAGLQR